MPKTNLFTFYFLLTYALCLTPYALNSQELEKEIRFSDHKWLPFYNFKKANNTTIFHGNKKESNYFEGWYFKMVSKDGSSILSVIPGISLSADGSEQHAFIQTINGTTAQTNYYSYPIEDFSFDRKGFTVKIGNSYFSNDSIILNIEDNGSVVSGKVKMMNTIEYRSGGLIDPGIMGWYKYVPFMECYHGVVSITHGLRGELVVDGQTFNFTGGKGYIEKDWGSSMPSSWIWMQSNHFSDSTTSFMLSIANIPWMQNEFTGFLGFFYHNNEIHRFATYLSTKLLLEIDDNSQLNITIDNGRYTFMLKARSNNTGLLKAPVEGSMDRRIAESIDATIEISMLDKKGKLMYQDSTNIAGLEMVGDYYSLEGLLK